jgi:hypothetical protein
MGDLVVAAVVLGALYLIVKRTGTPQVLTQTPAPSPPLLPLIPNPIIIGDSYGVPPFSVNNAPGASPTSLPSTINPPPGQPPPPAVLGGIAGGLVGLVGTGGLPLGGPLTPGVSTGTGNTAAMMTSTITIRGATTNYTVNVTAPGGTSQPDLVAAARAASQAYVRNGTQHVTVAGGITAGVQEIN